MFQGASFPSGMISILTGGFVNGKFGAKASAVYADLKLGCKAEFLKHALFGQF